VRIHLYTRICAYVKPGGVELGRAFSTFLKRRANRLERKEKSDVSKLTAKIALTTATAGSDELSNRLAPAQVVGSACLEFRDLPEIARLLTERLQIEEQFTKTGAAARRASKEASG
jgi:hypothetical protein